MVISIIICFFICSIIQCCSREITENRTATAIHYGFDYCGQRRDDVVPNRAATLYVVLLPALLLALVLVMTVAFALRLS